MSSLRVPHTAASVALVRDRMTAELTGCSLPDAVIDAAAVVVSELVGNAVRHGAALPGGGLLASWEMVDAALRVQVVDGGRGPSGQRAPAAPDAEGGRGLELVRALALRWGVFPGADSTAVWAELPAAVPLPTCPVASNTATTRASAP